MHRAEARSKPGSVQAAHVLRQASLSAAAAAAADTEAAELDTETGRNG
jgi:hypothetical protein